MTTANVVEVAVPAEVRRREVMSSAFNINGHYTEVDFQPHWTLVDLLRNHLDMTGTKEACGEGVCGACTVFVDGMPILSCLTLASTVLGKRIDTIEGMSPDNKLTTIQDAFLDMHGSQCGYCTAGFLMVIKHLLDNNPKPTTEEIKSALAGNICRCGGYEHIIDSVHEAARRLAEEVK
jgi:aerobic carbon-monoxide dehydrogenase small subunit